jgi:acetyl esterase/lipase
VATIVHLVLAALTAMVTAGCTFDGPVQNVLNVRLREAAGLWPPVLTAPAPGQEATISGQVLLLEAYGRERPAPGVTVVVAGPTGIPYTAESDSAGRYRLEGLPPGTYVPAAVGPGLEEGVAEVAPGIAWQGIVQAGALLEAPPIRLARHSAPALPAVATTADRAALQLAQVGATRVVTSPFPAGAAALGSSWHFVHDGARVDTLRLYQPLQESTDGQVEPAARRPLFLLVYPSFVDGWESVSVAFASRGYNVLALSPVEARAADIPAHAQDVRLALRLAQAGALGPDIDGDRFAVLGGSYSSAIVHRLLRDLAADGAQQGSPQAQAWVTVGGIANAFRGTADYYAGKLEIPYWHADAIPALGFPNTQPLAFLRFSPVYTAGQMPPTLILHTEADRVVPIAQGRELYAALERAQVPVQIHEYADTSHYLQVGEETTAAGMAMFERILAFLNERLALEEVP